MRAAVIAGEGKDRRLEVRDDVPEPQTGPGEILVRVRAAGLNRADLAMNARHRGAATAAGPPVPGNELAGEVTALGPDVAGLAVGDRVMGFGASAFAELAAIDHRHVFRVPDGLSWEKAATYPVALETMHDAVMTQGRLEPGETVLFQGAGSGVGMFGMQLAKAKGARLVIGASRRDERLAALPDFGMDAGVNTTDPDWPEKVRALTDGKGVDLVVDMVSGETVIGNMQAAAILGRIVNIGRLGGMTGPFDFDLHALKRIDYIGATFRTRTNDEIAAIVARAAADAGPLVASGAIGLPVHATFPLADIAEAYASMRTDAHLGKIVITV